MIVMADTLPHFFRNLARLHSERRFDEIADLYARPMVMFYHGVGGADHRKVMMTREDTIRTLRSFDEEIRSHGAVKATARIVASDGTCAERIRVLVEWRFLDKADRVSMTAQARYYLRGSEGGFAIEVTEQTRTLFGNAVGPIPLFS